MPQTSDSPVLAAASAVSPAWQWGVAATAFVASAVVCLLGYLAFAAPGPWLDSPPTLQWTARELTVPRGTAQLARQGLVVSAPDALRTAVIALNTSFRARDYPAVVWDVGGLPENMEVTLLWYSDINASRVFKRTLAIEAGHPISATLAGDPGWLGRIGGLALVLQGDFAQPIVVRGAAAEPMSALQVTGDRLREWLAFAPWTGASINGLEAQSDGHDLPFTVILAAVAGLAALLYAGLWRWRRGPLAPAAAAGFAVIFIAAWILADARWQWNLMRQADLTRTLYGGKSWEERHRAGEDGALFAFIDRVRNKLPPPPARVFVTADLAYFRARAAYHLYPYNVYYDPSSAAIPPPGTMRSGDYLLVYQRLGVQYDAAKQRLRWDGQPPIAAQLLITDAGAALFEIR